MALPPALAHEHPIAMAHRGSGLLWPENTMVAFQGAVDLGYRYLETDLQITRDGVLVTIHDQTVDRTTSRTGAVSDFNLAELQSLDAGYWFQKEGEHPYRGQGAYIPTLEEVVTTFPDSILTLDLKSNGLEGPLVDLIQKLGIRDRVIVGSFSGARLRRFRRLSGGRVATSAGPMETARFVMAAKASIAHLPAADCLQVPLRDRGITVVNRATVTAARKLGKPLMVWTINDPETMTHLLDLGVDGIITDRPDLLRTILRDG